MQATLAICLTLFFVVLVFISWLASRRVTTGEDYILAGRRMSPLLTMATIIATWFAAETILVTADMVRVEGISVIVFEPVGLGLCLILTGLIVARRLWQTRLLTLPDVIGAKFGKVAEQLVVFVNLSYIGWVAVQLLGLAGVFNVYFDLPIVWGIVLIAAVLTVYTLIGGLWAVAMTDIVQLVLLLVGLVLLTLQVLAEFGAGVPGGLAALLNRLDAALLEFVPTPDSGELSGWIGLIVLGVFANLAVQDVCQRLLAARSGAAARYACITAGVLYILFGALPILLGLAASLLLDASVTDGVVASLAEQFLSPTMSIVFVLTLTAAVTSSIDSGLLAPAAVLAHNVAQPLLRGRMSLLTTTRIAVVLVAVASTVLALSGTRAFDLLQGVYSLTLPTGIVLVAALYQKTCRPLAGAVTLAFGVAIWALQMVAYSGEDSAISGLIAPGFPLFQLTACALVYWATDQTAKRFERPVAASVSPAGS